ncbi:MAG: methylated-DNA--[protein]-cysteine S-methyltransferase [Thiohalomonadales bacterium]
MAKEKFSAIISIRGEVEGRKTVMALGINTEAGRVTSIQFLPFQPTEFTSNDTTTIETVRQIRAYFSNPTWTFTLPMNFLGSPFQNRVWRALTTMKPGETMTYGEMAKRLQSSARAVGNACRRNPLPIVVPCHRIISKSGLGGFSGQTEGGLVDFKQYLLEHESTYRSLDVPHYVS